MIPDGTDKGARQSAALMAVVEIVLLENGDGGESIDTGGGQVSTWVQVSSEAARLAFENSSWRIGRSLFRTWNTARHSGRSRCA